MWQEIKLRAASCFTGPQPIYWIEVKRMAFQRVSMAAAICRVCLGQMCLSHPSDKERVCQVSLDGGQNRKAAVGKGSLPQSTVDPSTATALPATFPL